MNDSVIIMKFEFLPNEIIIECFEYLNVFDIFHSFNKLNRRYTKLIQNIPIHLNFDHIRRRTFDQFCRKLLLNPEMKQQIYSLHLSNKDTCGQMKRFLSFFSFDDFSHLNSLTLTQIEKENIIQLKSKLPLLPNLFSLHLISSQTDEDEILSDLSLPNLQRLSILSLRSILKQTFIITHLTVYSCSLEQLIYQLFKSLPLLKYLNVENLTRYNRSIENNIILNKSTGVHLEQLVIGNFKYKFKDFEIFVKQIPNLKRLTITNSNDTRMLDATSWEILITCSLSNLNSFKFKFTCNRKNYDKYISDRLIEFQSDFWIYQHDWYTESFSDKYSICIYTIPYLSNSFKLEADTQRICFNSNNFDVFNNVTNLTLDNETITNPGQYRFSNVISLTLIPREQQVIDHSILINHIESLKLIVNFSKLKHLDISLYRRMILSGELLILVIESTQLSSITINPSDLKIIFRDDELCKHLNEKIKKLNIFKHGYPSSFANEDELKKFCKVFSRVEQIVCNMIQPENVLILLNQLSRLSSVKAHLSSLVDRQSIFTLLKEESRKLHFILRIRGIKFNSPELFVWIGRKVNRQCI